MGHLLRRARLIRVVAVGALIAALTGAVSAGGAIAYGLVAVGGGSGAAIGRGASSGATASPSAGAARFITDLAVLSQRQLVAIGSSSFLVSSDGGGTWQASAPGVKGIGGGFVLDRSRWWAASASTGSRRVTVAHTTNAGRSWTRTTLPATYRDGYGAACFSFEDAHHGWLTVGSVHSGAFAGADLYATSDGGASWRRLGTFPFTGPILFRAGRGYALAGVGGQSLETTTDGGRTWRPVALPIPVGLRARTRTLALLPARRGVAVEAWFAQTSMKYPVVLLVLTSRDGRTWASTKPLTANFGDFGMGTTLPVTPAPGGGWLATNAFTLFHSTAHGWTSRPTRLLSDLRIAFPSALNGFALVEYGHCQQFKQGCSSSSVVARTSDGGKNWTALALDGGLASEPPCQPSQLTGTSGFGGATGSELGGVALTNTSTSACVLADTAPQVTISWQGTALPTQQQRWPTSSNDLLHAPVRVLAPGASAEIDMQWFNWCGTPSEETAIQPSLRLQFATGVDVTIPATEQTMQAAPLRCPKPTLAAHRQRATDAPMSAKKRWRRVGLDRGRLATALVLLGLAMATSAALPAHASEAGHANAPASRGAWPQRTLLREQLPSNQVVSRGFLFAMVSLTNTPERGPYRLVRTTLATRTIHKGPLFSLPNVAVASGHLWITGSQHGLPRAIEVDPKSLRTIRAIRFSHGYGADPFVQVTPGPAGSVWLGTDRTLLRVSVTNGKALAKTSVPTGFVVADLASDPNVHHLYVSLARNVKGGMSGGRLIEDDAASGRQLATANSPLLSDSVAGAGLTAVPGGVWALFRTGMLGLTLHFRQSDLAQIAPPGPRIVLTPANGLFHWPMSASVLYGSGALWLTNESGVLACLDPATGAVRARQHISPQEVLDLFAVDPASHHLLALDNATTLIEITPPAECW